MIGHLYVMFHFIEKKKIDKKRRLIKKRNNQTKHIYT